MGIMSLQKQLEHSKCLFMYKVLNNLMRLQSI